MNPHPNKAARVRALAFHLARYHSPRVELAAILCATALAGFLSSRLMLAAGLRSMAVRYPLCTVAAYGAFLLLAGLWVRTYQTPGVLPNQVPPTLLPPDAPASPFAESPASDALNALDLVDLTEGGCFGLVGVLIAGLLFLVAASFVADAPNLLSELLLETSILGVLYPKLRSLPRPGWLSTLYGRTWLPVFVLAVVMLILGAALQHYAPDAHSIGGVISPIIGS